MRNQREKTGKKLMIAGAATLLTTAMIPAAAGAAFTDVSETYRESVTYLVDHELANGISDTQFGIQSTIKRGDAAIILAEALGVLNPDVPRAEFTDVPERGALAISSLKYHGIINGKSETRFGFNDTLTRGEIALMMAGANAYQLKGDKELLTFTDVSDRYAEAVAGLVANGITSGKSDNEFGTNDDITRGEFAVFIHRAEVADTIDEAVAEVVSLDEAGMLVKLRPNVEAQSDFTVDVVNPEGETLEVEPVPVEEDMSTAILEFETPLMEVTEGTWVIDGVEFSAGGTEAQ